MSKIITSVEEAKAAIKTGKIVQLKRTDLPPTKQLIEENGRRIDAYEDDGSMLYALRTEGQDTPIVVSARPGGGLLLLRGNCRVVCGFDRAGDSLFETGPHKGKRMADHIDAVVLPELAPDVEAEIRGDQRQQRGSDPLLLATKLYEMGRLGVYTPQQMVARCAKLIRDTFPLKAGVSVAPVSEDNGASLLAAKKGQLQGYLAVGKLPTEVWDQFRKHVAGQQRWPRHQDVFKLASYFAEDLADAEAARKAGKNIAWSKEKPGPKYRELWKAIKSAGKSAEESGNTTPNAVGMIDRKSVGNLHASSPSKMLRMIGYLMLNKAKWADGIATITPAILAIEESKAGAALVQTLESMTSEFGVTEGEETETE